MKVFKIVFSLALIDPLLAMITYNIEKNISDVAIALSEIIYGLKPRQLAILAAPPLKSDSNSPNSRQQLNNDDAILQHVGDFIYQLHKLNFKSVIFYDVELFFEFIGASLHGSIESVNLIFADPYELSTRIQERKLAHRLSLFMFYWGAKRPPNAKEVHFAEPMRAVVITSPRAKAFRIYYNQALPNGLGNLSLINWYDGNNLGLQKSPLLPSAATVYTNFQRRVFRVPVFHSPPWFWVNYDNDTNNLTALDISDISAYDMEYKEVNVTSGRDHCLLKLLAKHMNFQFVYIDTPGRTQGSLRLDGDANESFTGGIGLLQNGLADFLLGDVSLSWERRKAVEFSFFTLADSGAFATHARRRLNEALAIIRPFKMDVWPYLILTVIFSGPIFYGIIALPYKWHARRHKTKDRDVEKVGELTFYMVYIKEITGDNEGTRRLLRIQQLQQQRENVIAEMPANLFDRCIWFTVQLFLKQSCQELYHGYRAKFLMIVYWIAATYVLADVYSAQLTSEFARPPHEPPLNTLHRLQVAMIDDGYQLYVEKESSSLEMLENGTEIFRHLFALMKQQTPNEEGYLIDSIESGLQLIADGEENKAVLGGRETLLFNIQQFGSRTFQLSDKLYTRYSAVAVQIGCPFLDSLNDVLIRLFEGGILDKMTAAEYEAQSRIIGKELSDQQMTGDTNTEITLNEDNTNTNNEANGKNVNNAEMQKSTDNQIIQPLNLRMLQGAFIVLFVGYSAAGFVFMLELLCYHLEWNLLSLYKVKVHRQLRVASRKFWRMLRMVLIRILR